MFLRAIPQLENYVRYIEYACTVRRRTGGPMTKKEECRLISSVIFEIANRRVEFSSLLSSKGHFVSSRRRKNTEAFTDCHTQRRLVETSAFLLYESTALFARQRRCLLLLLIVIPRTASKLRVFVMQIMSTAVLSA